MENKTDFDALARKANESGGALEDLNKLFAATFALENWDFIVRGSLPNINPYIAANAGYAGGQQMIRAFTDSDRLLRFAKENNLTNAAGGAEILSVPTANIVDYLENFIQYGVHGIWFNSDTTSDGYFIPLKQLRSIKEHLAKLQAAGGTLKESGFIPPSNAQKPPLETVIIIINDGLMLPSGFVKKSDYTCNLYCLVPQNWTENGLLKENDLEKFYEKMYGATWRGGNGDGSRYVVDNSFSAVLTAEQLKGADWTHSQNTAENHFWFYVAGANGEIASVKPPEFQKEFEVSRQSPTAPPAPKPSNLEDWGLSKSPDGEIDLNIRIFRTGNVKLDTQLVSFYTTIVSLLQDYKGSGEYEKIFNFAPEAMHNLKESFGSNAHGEYFRLRTFQYAPPNAVGDATTIDSRQLHHIKTGAPLKCSFALLQIQDNPTAAIYFGFEGSKTEVFKLQNAVAPALEAAGFVEAETKK